MTPLRWTREAPKEAGWYWYRRDGYTDGAELVSRLLTFVEVLPHWIGTWGGEHEKRHNGMWAGPIAPPEEARSGDPEAAEEEAT
jgi:hypothetical protein